MTSSIPRLCAGPCPTEPEFAEMTVSIREAQMDWKEESGIAV